MRGLQPITICWLSIKVALAATLLAALGLGCSSADDGEGATGASAAASDSRADTRGDAAENRLSQQFDLAIPMSSTEFNDTKRIPRKYSCTNEDISVPVTWGEVPEGTVSLALLMESNQHPGPLWTHWLLWGIPPDAVGLPEALPNTPEVPSIGPKARQGTNGDDKVGWSGPCKEPLLLKFASAKPTDRLTSDYFFRLYALDSDISLGSDATKAAFLQAIDGHILAAGELVGQQQRLTKHCKAGC